MRITHFGHACMLVETGDARLLFDPGTDSTGWEALRDLTAVLVTHEHDDHVDHLRLPALLANNAGIVLVADRDTAAKLDGARAVEPGDSLELGGATVDVVGGSHAPVYLHVPDCTNTGYLVGGGEFYHPGDSFFAPSAKVDILALPIGGPWLKVSDAVDFLNAIAPRIAVPIHEAALAHPGQHIGMLTAFAPEGTTVTPLDRGTPTLV